jgi:YYY domain-containing protein
MDMAIVNAINRSPFFPPHDPWLAGTHVNYYYFGHYLVGFLVRVTGIDPAVGFNLAVALFYALVTTAVFGVAAVLYEAARRSGGAPRRSPVVVGLTAAAFATAIGNLAGGVQLLEHSNTVSSYDWWAPSRVIPGTANEFPFFSFLLADLHAHVMATPFALVTVAYAVQLALHGPPRWSRAGPWRRPAAELLLAALVLGALYPINSFDFPTACLIGAGGLLLWALEQRGRRGTALAWGGAWLVASVVLFLPFWRDFSPPAHGIAIVRHHLRFSSFLRDYLYIYAVPLWVVLGIFATRYRLPRKYLVWAGSVAFFLLVLLSPSRLAGPAFALFVAALAAYVTLATGKFSQPYRVLWLLVTVALALLASGEVVYLRDVFDGSPTFRFNTVFKTGYQAWFLFAIVAGVGVYWSGSWLGRRVRAAWLVVLGGLVALALVYPIFASYSRSLRFDAGPTLDGMRWLERSAPGDAAGIDWLRRSVSGSPTVLEAPAGDFDPAGGGRVSTFTGLPAVIGWAGHEVQWGHDPGPRIDDARRIYGTDDLAVARKLLNRYRVRYVFVGTLERHDYPAAALAKFARLGTQVFSSGTTDIYKIRA